MASTVILNYNLPLPNYKYNNNNKTLALVGGGGRQRRRRSALTHSQFLSSNSLHALRNHFLLKLNFRISQAVPFVISAQSNLFNVLQTVWKVSRDAVEAGTGLVPDSIPRPIARISITVVGATLTLFLLQSFLSTAFFAVAVMGLCYFTFLALNKDEGPKGGGGSGDLTSSTEDSLEEARRIMDKYK